MVSPSDNVFPFDAASKKRREKLQRIFWPHCIECKGAGRICVGSSGFERDGNAPVLEVCEGCDGRGRLNPTDETGERCASDGSKHNSNCGIFTYDPCDCKRAQKANEEQPGESK